MSSIKAKFRILEQEPIKAVFKVNAVIPADEIKEDLQNEISRAKQAENQLQGQINGITSDIDDISEELTTKADKSNTYTKNEVDIKISTVEVDAYTKAETNQLLATKQPIGDYVTTTKLNTEVSKLATKTSLNITNQNLDALTGDVENIAGELDSKQNTLISGTNIKTINNKSILGSGNIDIQGGGASSFADLEGQPYDNDNLKNAFDSKQDKLTSANAGDNITITYSGGTSILPDGYTQFSYMESSGIQVVNAGTVSNGEWVEIVFSPTVISGSGSSGYSGIAGVNGAPQMGYYRDGWTAGNAGSSIPYLPVIGDIYTYKWTSIDGRFYIDDIWTNLIRNGILTLNLFQCEGSSRPSRIYEVRKYNANNELVLHLYPAGESSTYRNGMYDIVNNVFYPSNVNLIQGDEMRGEDVIISADLSEYATKNDLATKQDIITDLGDIRNNISTNTSNISYLDEKVRDIELFKFPNAVIIGEPTIQNGQVSNFSTVSYLQFPFILDLHNQAFQIDFSFTTATNVQTQQNILDSNFGLALAIQNGKGVMAISSNGTSWDIGSATGNVTIQSNTTYYARLTWNRLQYKTQLSTDGVNYVDDMVITNTKSPYPRTMFIGGCDILETGHTGHPFLGTINMNKASLSVMGNVIWQGMDDAGLATRADLSLSNLDELGEARFNNKQDVLTNILGYDATKTQVLKHVNGVLQWVTE